ncbi:hypothetical protein CLIM01_15123 [Colletotrichum limetticola]|uniref:Uncharacterized protein n=1 Tax=Colletotrichum limetticola TaxID=1209924 RepID=A0ABQ9P6L1_9PEZI|nr:hypothetical protein CLIM01_15123 [Colletotrichum limetticola]
MPSRISIEYLLTPTAVTPTLCDETEAIQEDMVGPHTPPADAMSPSINFQHQQVDMDQYSDTRGHATSACSLLSPAKLTSSGEPTLDDIVSIYTRQSLDVTSSSMDLQEQMFSGYYNGPCVVNNTSRSLAQQSTIRPSFTRLTVATVDGMLDAEPMCPSQQSIGYRAALIRTAHIFKPGSLMNTCQTRLTLLPLSMMGRSPHRFMILMASPSRNRALLLGTSTTEVFLGRTLDLLLFQYRSFPSR